MANKNIITEAYCSKVWTFHIVYKRKRYQVTCEVDCDEVYGLEVIRFVKKGKTYYKLKIFKDEKIINAIDKIVQDYLYDHDEISFTNYYEED